MPVLVKENITRIDNEFSFSSYFIYLCLYGLLVQCKSTYNKEHLDEIRLFLMLISNLAAIN